jgi:hypothetical protein
MLKIKYFFMKKISLAMLWLATFLLLACNNKQPQQSANTDQQQEVLKDTLLNASWSVKGCAEKATRSDTKFPASGDFNNYPPLTTNEMGVKATGDSIVYNRFEEHLCCRKVKVATEKKGNVITITEYWFGQGCKCKCSSTVHAVIRDLAKGEYQVYGIATGTDPVDDKPTAGRDTVLRQLLTIK